MDPGLGWPSRRRFLGVAGVAAGLGVLNACTSDEEGGADGGEGDSDTGPTSSTTLPEVPDLAGDPFTLGVASGDPLADRVILWTRLAPAPIDGGGMPSEPVPVIWEMSTDEGFSDILRSGIVEASPEFAHSVHVDADELEADSWYHYRFRVGDWTSADRPHPNDADDGFRGRLAHVRTQLVPELGGGLLQRLRRRRRARSRSLRLPR